MHAGRLRVEYAQDAATRAATPRLVAVAQRVNAGARRHNSRGDSADRVYRHHAVDHGEFAPISTKATVARVVASRTGHERHRELDPASTRLVRRTTKWSGAQWIVRRLLDRDVAATRSLALRRRLCQRPADVRALPGQRGRGQPDARFAAFPHLAGLDHRRASARRGFAEVAARLLAAAQPMNRQRIFVWRSRWRSTRAISRSRLARFSYALLAAAVRAELGRELLHRRAMNQPSTPPATS